MTKEGVPKGKMAPQPWDCSIDVPQGLLPPPAWRQHKHPHISKAKALQGQKASRWLSPTVWKGTEGQESCKEQLKRAHSLLQCCRQKLIKVWSVALWLKSCWCCSKQERWPWAAMAVFKATKAPHGHFQVARSVKGKWRTSSSGINTRTCTCQNKGRGEGAKRSPRSQGSC